MIDWTALPIMPLPEYTHMNCMQRTLQGHQIVYYSPWGWDIGVCMSCSSVHELP